MTYIKDLQNSLKHMDPRTIVYDTFSFILFYASYFAWSLYTLNLSDKVEALNIPDDLYLMSPEQADIVYNSIQAYLWKAAIATALLFIICLLIFAVAKYLIWSHLLKKKPKLKPFLHFLLNTSIYIILSLAVLYFIMGKLRLLSQTSYLTILYLIIILLTYLATILFIYVTKKPKLKTAKHAFIHSFTKLKYYIIPLVTLFIPLIIVWELLQSSPQLILVFCAILIIWMAWSRSYILYVTESLK